METRIHEKWKSINKTEYLYNNNIYKNRNNSASDLEAFINEKKRASLNKTYKKKKKNSQTLHKKEDGRKQETGKSNMDCFHFLGGRGRQHS